MIIYLKNTEIDRDQWDACIGASDSHKPYAWSWYLDIMAPGWEAMIDDDYDSVFPIPCNKRFGIRYIATPVFLQHLGAYSPDKSTADSVVDFLAYMPEFYSFIDLCIGQKINDRSFRVSERSNYQLDLSHKYDRLWSDFEADCRRDIQAATKRKHEITRQIKPDEILSLFTGNTGKIISGIKPADYSRLKELMNYCISTGKGEILGVRGTGKRLIYAVFIINLPKSHTTLLIAGTPESRERRTGYFVINEIIRDNAGTRSILDFAGSSIDTIAHFVKSFGSTNHPYYRIYRNKLPFPVRIFK